VVQIKIKNELAWHVISAGRAYTENRENGRRRVWEAKAESREMAY